MTGNAERACVYLKESAEIADAKPETLLAVEHVLGKQSCNEKLSMLTTLQVNTAASLFCQGNTLAAKE